MLLEVEVVGVNLSKYFNIFVCRAAFFFCLFLSNVFCSFQNFAEHCLLQLNELFHFKVFVQYVLIVLQHLVEFLEMIARIPPSPSLSPLLATFPVFISNKAIHSCSSYPYKEASKQSLSHESSVDHTSRLPSFIVYCHFGWGYCCCSSYRVQV